jgi:ABC-type molybdenum transport system ATPase subunit/photorepair protein PhrA
MSLHAVSVRRGRQWALRDISLAAAKPGSAGRCIGDNGAGKTQLLKLLAAMCGRPPPARSECGAFIDRDRRRTSILIEAKQPHCLHRRRAAGQVRALWLEPAVRDVIATGLHRTDLLLLPVTPPQA